MHAHFIKTALAATLAAVVMTGCGTKAIKPVERKPAKLAKIESSVSVLSPIFAIKLDQGGSFVRSKSKAKDVIDMQVAPTASGLVAASRGGVVTAFVGDQAVWSVNLGVAITSGVAANDETVVIGNRLGEIVALDAKSGQQLWKTQLSSVSLTPALLAQGLAVISTNGGVSYALNLKTGQVVWQYSTQAPTISVRGLAKPVLLIDGVVMVGASDGRLHILDLANGMPIFIQRVGLSSGLDDMSKLRDVDGEPVVLGDMLYAASYSGQLIGFNFRDNRLAFVGQLPSIKSLAVRGDQVLGSSIDGELAAFNRMTGQKLWQNDELKFRRLTNPVTVGSYVAVGDYEGLVHLLDGSGKIVSRIDLKNNLTSLQVVGNRLYAQSTNGVVNVWQF